MGDKNKTTEHEIETVLYCCGVNQSGTLSKEIYETVVAPTEAALNKRIAELEDALRIYACKQNWDDELRWNGLDGHRAVALKALVSKTQSERNRK